MKNETIKAYKICLLTKKINKIRKSIPEYHFALYDRNRDYHKGKLNTDSLMVDFKKEKYSEIFSIKREIVKLKNQ